MARRDGLPHDLELYVGDGRDGCTIGLDEQQGGGWRAVITLDANENGFAEDIGIVRADTLTQTCETAQDLAREWCEENGVNAWPHGGGV